MINKQELIEHVFGAIRNITMLKSSDLIRTDLPGDLKFNDFLDTFEDIFKLCRDIQNHIGNLPIRTLQNLKHTLEETNEVLEKIKKYNPDGNDPNEDRKKLIEAVHYHHSNLFSSIAPILSYIDRYSSISDRLHEIDKIIENAKNKKEEAEEIIASMRALSGQAGVAKHASIFDETANHHKTRCFWWLFATISISILTMVMIFSLFKPEGNSTTELIKNAIPKIMGFSILYFGIIWSSRIYKSHWHNYVVNKHRHNSLNTFETFIRATKDQQIKDAVLLQTTQSIFSPQSSGFIQQDSESSNPSTIMEIIRSFSSPK